MARSDSRPCHRCGDKAAATGVNRGAIEVENLVRRRAKQEECLSCSIELRRVPRRTRAPRARDVVSFYMCWMVARRYTLDRLTQAGCPNVTLASNYLALPGSG